MFHQLKISLTEFENIELVELKSQWLALESKSNNSIFTSWLWVSTWLKSNAIKPKCQLLKVTFNTNIVGLGFVTECSQLKKGFSFKQLWLNRTGNTKLDQIWSEYNDILCEPGVEYSIRAALIKYFSTELPQIDELLIGVSNLNIAETPVTNNITQYTSWSTSSYATKLSKNIADIDSFLNTLSSNTRKQIKRSLKLYQQNTQLKLTPARSIDEALLYFKHIGELHKKRWKDDQSGFTNEHFVDFHEELIRSSFEQGLIDILKIHSENETICYLYNLTYKNKVYFYLSGIEYKSDNRCKPGLMSHSMAIAHYAELGFELYDFMGGEGRYKESLGSKSDNMIIANFRRKRPTFILSQFYRKLKSYYA